MNVATRQRWTVEQFLDWADGQEERFEFDGERPVPMNGVTGFHSAITQNVLFAFRLRLRGSGSRCYGPDLGIRTVGNRIRYPDALVTCTAFPGLERLAPNPVVVFEVISPGSERVDRIEKLAEYAAVPSIRHYAIIESNFAGVTVFSRGADEEWLARGLTRAGDLALPALGVTLPVAELYEDITFDSPLPSREELGEGDVQS